MVGYYRLKPFDFRLAGGAHVIKRAEFEPVEAAEELVASARGQAESILAEAQGAYEAEARRGYADGLARAELDAMERLLRENQVLEARLDGIESELASLVVAGVRRIVDDFSDREKAEALVRAALAQMRRERKAELRVSQAQFRDMREAMDRIRGEFPELQSLDVVSDDTLEAPSVVVETAIGRVEGNLPRGLAELEAILKGVGAAGIAAAAAGAGAGA